MVQLFVDINTFWRQLLQDRGGLSARRQWVCAGDWFRFAPI
jgi:hypothetical protein